MRRRSRLRRKRVRGTKAGPEPILQQMLVMVGRADVFIKRVAGMVSKAERAGASFDQIDTLLGNLDDAIADVEFDISDAIESYQEGSGW